MTLETPMPESSPAGPRGLQVLPLLIAALGEPVVEWMYPGFIALHLPDGSLLACGDGEAGGWCWHLDHQRADGTVALVGDGPALTASLDEVAAAQIAAYRTVAAAGA